MRKEKKMGFWMLTTLVSGNMIGAGIFLLPSSLAKLGSISLVAWVLTAVGAFTLAMVYARLSLLIPKVGGPYAYVEAGLGRFMGFQTAYVYWLVTWIGNAAFVVATVSYLTVFFPCLQQPLLACLVEIAIVWCFTYINMRGTHIAGQMQIVTTVLKLLPIMLVAILGWWYFHPHYLTSSFNVSHTSHLSALSKAAILTMWTFLGLECATVPANSVDNPKRNIPLATLCGTLIAAVVYISSATAVMGMLPNHALVTSNSPFADAAGVIFGAWGRWAIALGAIISCLGCLNGWILVQGQIPMAAANDGLFPKVFGRRNAAGVPAAGLVVTAIFITALLMLVSGLSLIDQFDFIVLIATFGYLAVYFYSVCTALLFLRKRRKWWSMQMVVTLFAGAYSIWTLFGAGKEIVFYGLMMLFSSVPLYAWIHVRRKKSL